MQYFQEFGKAFSTAWAAVGLAFYAASAQGAEGQAANKLTFDYGEYRSFSELTNAVREIQERLDAAEKQFGMASTNAAELLSQLASCYSDLGEDTRAVDLDRRALSIRRAVFGPTHEDIAQNLGDLAIDYWDLGDNSRAEALFLESLSIAERVLGTNHFRVATAINNLADFYREQDRFPEALPLCQCALEIRRRVLGPQHPDVADSLATLAQIRLGVGMEPEALEAAQQSLAISERVLGPTHPVIADGLRAKGDALTALGRFADALAAYQRGLAVDERAYGVEESAIMEDLRQIAILFARQSQWEQGLSSAIRLSRAQRRYLTEQSLALSDAGALRTLRAYLDSTELLQSLCFSASEESSTTAWRAGAEELALSKGLLEELRAAQAIFDANPNTAVGELRGRYHTLQKQLEWLPKSGLGTAQLEATRRDQETELRKVAQQISERSALLAETLRERNLSLGDVARALPTGAAFLDLVEYRHCNFMGHGTNQWKEPRYAAYLTFPQTDSMAEAVVHRVDLGEAAPIDSAVARLFSQIQMGHRESSTLWAALHELDQLVYTPLAGYLSKVSHLIVCPDGQLCRLPFEMLSHEGMFLIESMTVSYVGSGREIVRLAAAAAPKTQLGPCLVMGAPDFDLNLADHAGSLTGGPVGNEHQPPKSSKSLFGAVTTRSVSRDAHAFKFQPLREAEAEARTVAKLLGQDCLLLVGAEARKSELKAVDSPKVLHLATHGFYLTDQEAHRSLPRGDSAVARSESGWDALAPAEGWENPMIRCGLALAGANHAFMMTNSAATDGLLTGREASMLNLQGTELVILSACDSGNGEVRIGEGVMSLRRAFRIAGAQTVLASHWQVSDRATDKLMTTFVKLWRGGKPRAEAWRGAQLALVHQQDFSNPYFWAAFTLTGQWK